MEDRGGEGWGGVEEALKDGPGIQGSPPIGRHSIRDFPDHATFRGSGAKLACADKLGVFLSSTLCKKATFAPLQGVKYDDLEKM